MSWWNKEKRQQRKPIDLILSSSGVRAPCFVGGIEALLEKGYDIKRIAGTSGGAIIASMYALGNSIPEMKDKSILTPYASFKGFSYKNLMSLTNPSLYTGEGLDAYYQELFGEAVLKDFQIDCRISVVTIDGRNKITLNRDSHPDLLVWKAVRMSSTIPFIFPYLYLGDIAVTDGSLVSRSTDVFRDSEREVLILHPRADGRLRALLRQKRFPKEPSKKGNVFLWTYIKILIEFFMDSIDNQHIPQDEWNNTIIIPTEGIGSFNFDLTEDEITELLKHGYEAVMNASSFTV